VDLNAILDLEPDDGAWVGRGPTYPWGGLYGGQIVAQALIAAAAGVDPVFEVHSLRAYFIRRGDHHESVRYEVDPIRDGRSFATRRVVAHQDVGAILNLEASFQRPERSADVETVELPAGVPGPDELEPSSWSPVFERAMLPPDRIAALTGRDGAGRAMGWFRVGAALDDDPTRHAAGLAYVSDDLPTDAVVRAHPVRDEPQHVLEASLFSASLDHTMWFHRPFRADEWHLHDVTCHTFVDGRGLALGHVFSRSGTHVATFAQEALDGGCVGE
jgi:acyl-CoA thioesterase-2